MPTSEPARIDFASALASVRAFERKTIRDPSRQQRLAILRAALGETEIGRELELNRLRTLADFRASVPLLDRASHATQVTARLGFDLGEVSGAELSAGDHDRAELIEIWRLWLERAGPGQRSAPRRIALLHAAVGDPLIDRMRLDDLAALAGAGFELLRFEQLDAEPDRQLAQLRDWQPDTLVLPSLATCKWIEGLVRAPLERSFPSLCFLFAEHDLDQRIRSRLPVINSGWIHSAGRVGLPARRSPWQGFSLATRSLLIELLPHGDLEIDPRQRPTSDTLRRPDLVPSREGPAHRPNTVMPEQAVLGESYELVFSSPLGFLRMRSDIHVRVVGFVPPPRDGDDTLPRPRVVRLPPPPSDVALEGVTLAGAWLTASVRQAFMPEDPALVAGEIAADPDALDASGRASRAGLDPFAETELAANRIATRRKGPRPRALVVRVEIQGQTDPGFAARLARRVDEDLRRRSPAYEWLRNRDELWDPRVVIAKPGTMRRGREARIRSLSGMVERPIVRIPGSNQS